MSGTTNDKWQEIVSSIPSPLNAHFLGSTASLGETGLIVSLPSNQANVEQITKQIEPKYIAPKARRLFGDVPIIYQASLPDMPEPKPPTSDSFKIRDRRGNNRYYIDNVFLRQGYGATVGPYGIALYNALCLHADYDYQDCWPSYKLLAELTGMSKRQAIYKAKELEDLNVIEVERRREGKKNLTNVITLTAVKEWKKIKQSNL